MSRAWFVAGTDTGVGKTLVSCALLHAARRQGLTTAALKPVAAGCEATAQGWRNDDALRLQGAASLPLRYEQVNPVALPLAIAPHLAAAAAGVGLSAADLASRCRPVLELGADVTLIEGAGGWRVPLNDRETLADLAKLLALPVILVVALRLGCLNHALLTAEAIRGDGLVLAGWVANSPDGGVMSHRDANRDALAARLGCPLLGDIPGLEPAALARAADWIDSRPLWPSPA